MVCKTLVQQELLSVKDLTVTRALEKAQAIEAASRKVRVFQQSEKGKVSPVVHEDQVKDTLLVTKATAPRTMVCYRCGNNNHAAAKCPIRTNNAKIVGKWATWHVYVNQGAVFHTG